MKIVREVKNKEFILENTYNNYVLSLKVKRKNDDPYAIKRIIVGDRKNLEMIREMIDNILVMRSKTPPDDYKQDYILHLVCSAFLIDQQELFSKHRHSHLIWARHMFRYFSYLNGMNFNVQELSGYGMHGTIKNSVNNVLSLIEFKNPSNYYYIYCTIKQAYEENIQRQSTD